MKRIIIDGDDEHTPEQTLEEVLRLVREGYTSGINPTFEVVEVEE